MTIIEKLESHTKSFYAIALLNADDEARERDSGAPLRPRARQNVILETGLFLGVLGRQKRRELFPAW